jgi:subtilisin family serine protease
MNRFLPATLFGLIVLSGLPGLSSQVGGPASAWASDEAIEDAIHEQTEAEISEQVEDEISEQVEDAIEEDIEDQVSEQVEQEVDAEVEDRVEEAIQSDVEDRVEEDVEDRVEEDVEDRVEEDVEDRVEADVEDRVEEDVEDRVEDDVEDRVEADVEDRVEDDVEDSVEEDVEDSVEEDVEDRVEEDVEDRVEEDVEDRVEEDVEDSVEEDVEDRVEEDVEDSVEEDVEDSVEDAVEGDVEDSVANALEIDVEDRQEKEIDDVLEFRSGDNPSGSAMQERSRERLPARDTAAATSAAERFVELELDDEGNEFSLGEWLVIAAREDIVALEAMGYVTRNVELLEGLDRVLATMEAPESFDIAKAQAVIGRAAPRAEVDYNHVYRPEARQQPHASGGIAPRALFPAAASAGPAPVPIGLIDTAVAADHPSLRAARVQYRDFTPPGSPQPVAHGTSVLSILVGEAPDYRGLIPGTDVLAGAVFFYGPDGGEIATTSSLVRALDWMSVKRVPVVNMSLAGPQNAVLATAIERAFDTGTVVVAAVGNRGPAARPLYPAAYEHVIAVTAVNGQRRVYRLANRGPHVDFAAPGVNVLHADGETGYRSSSGTSMAAPFVTAVIATSCAGVRPIAACLKVLQRNADDIGEAGFDPVFGHGVVMPLRSSTPP